MVFKQKSKLLEEDTGMRWFVRVIRKIDRMRAVRSARSRSMHLASLDSKQVEFLIFGDNITWVS